MDKEQQQPNIGIGKKINGTMNIGISAVGIGLTLAWTGYGLFDVVWSCGPEITQENITLKQSKTFPSSLTCSILICSSCLLIPVSV